MSDEELFRSFIDGGFTALVYEEAPRLVRYLRSSGPGSVRAILAEAIEEVHRMRLELDPRGGISDEFLQSLNAVNAAHLLKTLILTEGEASKDAAREYRAVIRQMIRGYDPMKSGKKPSE